MGGDEYRFEIFNSALDILGVLSKKEKYEMNKLNIWLAIFFV